MSEFICKMQGLSCEHSENLFKTSEILPTEMQKIIDDQSDWVSYV